MYMARRTVHTTQISGYSVKFIIVWRPSDTHGTSCQDGLGCVSPVTNNIGDNATQTQITIQILLIHHKSCQYYSQLWYAQLKHSHTHVINTLPTI